jgi:hypothetical protein
MSRMPRTPEQKARRRALAAVKRIYTPKHYTGRDPSRPRCRICGEPMWGRDEAHVQCRYIRNGSEVGA